MLSIHEEAEEKTTKEVALRWALVFVGASSMWGIVFTMMHYSLYHASRLARILTRA